MWCYYFSFYKLTGPTAQQCSGSAHYTCSAKSGRGTRISKRTWLSSCQSSVVMTVRRSTCRLGVGTSVEPTCHGDSWLDVQLDRVRLTTTGAATPPLLMRGCVAEESERVTGFAPANDVSVSTTPSKFFLGSVGGDGGGGGSGSAGSRIAVGGEGGACSAGALMGFLDGRSGVLGRGLLWLLLLSSSAASALQPAGGSVSSSSLSN